MIIGEAGEQTLRSRLFFFSGRHYSGIITSERCLRRVNMRRLGDFAETSRLPGISSRCELRKKQIGIGTQSDSLAAFSCSVLNTAIVNRAWRYMGIRWGDVQLCFPLNSGLYWQLFMSCQQNLERLCSEMEKSGSLTSNWR